MNAILFDDSKRLRSGWRALIFVLAFVLATIPITSIILAVTSAIDINTTQGSLFLATNAIISLISAIVIGWLCGRFLEHLPLKALGVSFTAGWLKHFLLGLGIGAAALSFAVMIVLIFGGETFYINPLVGTGSVMRSLAVSFLIFGVAAAFEEALFRGYILQTFARSGLAWLAICLTSIFFGLVHLGNPNVSSLAAVNTILAGVWFSVAYLKTRDLWFVWGIHLMWNWMQGSIFGIEVSGLTEIATAPLLKEIDTGPTWLTGTTYGIEGGVAATIAIIIAIAAVYFLPLVKPDNELLAFTSKGEAKPIDQV